MNNSNTQSATTTLHGGVFVAINNYGVLITGKSGIGKSELGLSLLKRGHIMIADDVVIITKESDQLLGTCPELLRDFLEIRGLGVINIRKLFGAQALQHEHRVDLLINLMDFTVDLQSKMDRLQGLHSTECILDVELPSVSQRTLLQK